MGKGKNLSALSTLPPAVLDEVVREGEARISAQFEAANSGDQRGLAWAGFVITVATASVGASAALAVDGRHYLLALLAGLMAAAFCVSAFHAVDSVRPRKFGMPGNLPENWLPEEWNEGSTHTFVEARVEQATCLNNLIDDNIRAADKVGDQLGLSIDIAFWSVAMGAFIAIGLAALGLLAA